MAGRVEGIASLGHDVVFNILLSEPPVLLDVKHSYQWSSAMDTELSIEKGFSKHCQPLGHSVLTKSINASGYAALTKLVSSKQKPLRIPRVHMNALPLCHGL
ncbi:hypothetical protein Tco_1484156 [Tanacetum coccineum]